MPFCDVCGYHYMAEEGVWVNGRFFICRCCLRDIIDEFINGEVPFDPLIRALVDEVLARAEKAGRQVPLNRA